VILSSKGFNDRLNQMGFMARVAHQDANIVKLTRTARAEVSRQATALESLETRDRALANQVLDQRNQAAALRSALLREQLVQETKRANTTARYNAVKTHLGSLQARLDAIEKRAAEAATRPAATPPPTTPRRAVVTSGPVPRPPRGPARCGSSPPATPSPPCPTSTAAGTRHSTPTATTARARSATRWRRPAW
jgi:peptidoglycan hydrolase CwlO-like protein